MRIFKNYLLVLAAAVALILLNFYLTGDYLKARHLALEKRIGDPKLNALIYRYQAQSGIDRKILSNYQLLSYLPGLQDLYVHQSFEDPNPVEYQKYLENIIDPRIGYLLLSTNSSPAIIEHANRNITSGAFERIFESRGYIFIKINRDH